MKYLIILIGLLTTQSAFPRGSCNCPSDFDRAGRICGKRSAFCKLGGSEPLCGARSQSEAQSNKAKLCR